MKKKLLKDYQFDYYSFNCNCFCSLCPILRRIKRVCHKPHPYALNQRSPTSAAIFTPIARGGGDRCLRNRTSATSGAGGTASELALHTAPSG